MSNDQHILICDILDKKNINHKAILELNGLTNFNDCVIGKNDSVRNSKGHMLKGLSGNPVGRSKEIVQEEKERKKEFKSDIEIAVQMFLDEYGVHSPEDHLAFMSLKQCKTKYELDDWARLYMQYYRGKKQSIESNTHEKREIIVKIGSNDTTKLCNDFTKHLKDVTSSTNQIESI